MASIFAARVQRVNQACVINTRIYSSSFLFKAFERAELGFKLDDGILVRITETYYKAALNIIQHCHMKDEPLYACSGAIWGPDIEEYWMTSLRQNLSLLLLEKEHGNAIGIFILKVAAMHDTYPADALKDPGMLNELRFAEMCEKAGDVYKHFNVDETVHMTSLAVVEKYRRKGIGTKLVKVAMAFARELRVKDRVCLQVEGTSIYSNKILEKEGFQILCEKSFEEYTVDGKRSFRNTGEHKSIKMYGMMLPL